MPITLRAIIIVRRIGEMKIKISCMQCTMLELQETTPSEPAQNFIGDSTRVKFELQEDNIYRLTCKHGHITHTSLQQQKFQVLFELGAHAIAEGYYREAVASFTSSLERFYEFFVKAFLYQQGRNDEEVTAAWKPLSDNSLKQIGAFTAIFNLTFNEPPPLLSNNKTRFRNDVIHNGLIPTRAQAMDFGESIINLIWPTMAKMRETMAEGIWQTVRVHLAKAALQDLPNVSTMSIPMIIYGPEIASEDRPDLPTAVKRFEL